MIDLLGLDFGSPPQQQPTTNTQNNAGSFFGNTSTNSNQGFGDFGTQQTNTSSKPTGKDLLSLDFGTTPVNQGGNNNLSTQPTQTTTNTTNSFNNDLLGGGPTTNNTTQQQTKPKSVSN